MGDRLNLEVTPIAGLYTARSLLRRDGRGSFARLFCESELRNVWGDRGIVQVNLSTTYRRGAVRGLHYQRRPHAEMKMVRCLRGEVWDVAVDLRRGSPTFLRWHAHRLAAGDADAMLIPEGMAHGFQSMTDDVEMLYCHSAAFAPAAEAGLHPLDPRLAIEWPLPVTELSERDAGHPYIEQSFDGEPV